MSATLYVRGGLDPALDDPADLDAACRAILRSGDHTTRAREAAALIHGWVMHHDGARPVLAWHRLIGGTAVSVGRAA